MLAGSTQIFQGGLGDFGFFSQLLFLPATVIWRKQHSRDSRSRVLLHVCLHVPAPPHTGQSLHPCSRALLEGACSRGIHGSIMDVTCEALRDPGAGCIQTPPPKKKRRKKPAHLEPPKAKRKRDKRDRVKPDRNNPKQHRDKAAKRGRAFARNKLRREAHAQVRKVYKIGGNRAISKQTKKKKKKK